MRDMLDRQVRMLRSAMGAGIGAALEDSGVVEILANPDGSIWIDRLTEGRSFTGLILSAADRDRIIRLVASLTGLDVHSGAPILSAELPLSGERFEGVLPPVAHGPAFAIRKRAAGVIPLDVYVEQKIMTTEIAASLRQAIEARKNIVIAGGTSSGKTTLANALLNEIADAGERILVLEDTIELQCPAQDSVALRTRPGIASMTELVRSTLRLRPDRIIVGEVRGPEALDLLKAWGTGHPGGVATLHASSAYGALLRLEQLIQEAVITVPRALIAETVDIVLFLSGRGKARRVAEMLSIDGLDPSGNYRIAPLLKGEWL